MFKKDIKAQLSRNLMSLGAARIPSSTLKIHDLAVDTFLNDIPKEITVIPMRGSTDILVQSQPNGLPTKQTIISKVYKNKVMFLNYSEMYTSSDLNQTAKELSSEIIQRLTGDMAIHMVFCPYLFAYGGDWSYSPRWLSRYAIHYYDGEIPQPVMLSQE
jgi:hypothetical protein